MSRLLSVSLLLFSLISCLLFTANATSITFHVISPGAKAVQVVIGATTAPMTAADPLVPHFTATADVPDGSKYKYKVDGASEAFDRTVPGGRTDTYNDFFNRSQTVQELPPFPWPLQDEGFATAQWQRAAPLSPLFDDSYIPTLFFSENKLDGTPNKLYIILKDQIIDTDANWYEYKSDSWKQGSTFNLTRNADKLGGRNTFKLRTGEFDPTQLREKTYTDLMNALGVPVAQQVHVRVYGGTEPFGLFVLTDLLSGTPGGQRNFGFHEFEKGDPARQQNLGVSLDCGTGATFEYKTDNPRDYDACYGVDMTRSDAKMVELIKTLAAVSPNDTATQDAAEKILDVDGVLRQMVMEYLTINWDGYWSQSSNFVMYYDEFNTGKWFLSDQDFDQTFGNGNEQGDDPPASYKTYPVQSASRPSGKRPLIESFLAVPKYRERFEKILTETVKHTFNPVAFNRRIDAFAQIIRPEVQWDHSFHEDTGRYFYFADFDAGLTNPVTYRVQKAGAAATNLEGVGWGLKTFVEARASGVAREFNFIWDAQARDPPTAADLAAANKTNPDPGAASGSPAPPTDRPTGSQSNASANVVVPVVLLVGFSSLVALFALPQ